MSQKIKKTWIVIVKKNTQMKKKIATLFLIFGTFLNPFGFDAAQMILIQLTGSLYGANMVLYFLAASCFGLYFLLSGNNPLREIIDIILSIYNDKIKHYFSKR